MVRFIGEPLPKTLATVSEPLGVQGSAICCQVEDAPAGSVRPGPPAGARAWLLPELVGRPAAIWVTNLPERTPLVSTATGTRDCVVLPLPSCPETLLPQQ